MYPCQVMHSLTPYVCRAISEPWLGNYVVKGPDAAKFGASIGPLMQKHGDKEVQFTLQSSFKSKHFHMSQFRFSSQPMYTS